MSDSGDSEASAQETPSKVQGSEQDKVTDDSDFSSQAEDDASDDSSSESETNRPKENTRDPEVTRQKQLEIQQRQRAEAKREEEARRKEAERQARLEEARRQEEEEAQARRQALVDTPRPQVGYSCADCNGDVNLSIGALVRCQNCGCRILYKKKTNRLMAFKAD